MSEQISPLHDPISAMETQPLRARAMPRPRLSLSALTRDTSRTLTITAIVGILLIGAFLRLTHVNWDANAHLHPDERFLTQISVDTHGPSSIANFFDTKTSAANPYNIKKPDGSKQPTFVYGTLPLFLNKFVASHVDRPFDALDKVTGYHAGNVNDVLSALTNDTVAIPERNYDNYDNYNRSGRVLSGIFDVGTIVMIFLLGRLLANRKVGLLAAFLYAVSAFPIQNSHFFVVDPFVAFFATFTVYFAVRSAKYGGWRNFALAGIGAGLAAACKITAVSLLPVALLSVGVYAWPGIKPYVAPWFTGDDEKSTQARNGKSFDRSVLTLITGSLIVLVTGFLAFRIAMPYAFNTPSLGDLLTLRAGHLGPFPTIYPDIINQQWLGDQVSQQKLLSGDGAFPPNVQWIGRSKWIWPAQQMIAWGMGPALGVTAWLGVIFAAIYGIRKGQAVWLVPLAWILGYFGFMGAQFSLYMRYFLPLYPTLTVLAAFLLYHTWRWASSAEPLAAFGRLGERAGAASGAVPVLAKAGVVVVVLFTTLMGLAFYRIYSQPVTRATASVWIYENVPEGSVIGHEHWDDSVPYGQPGEPLLNYGAVEFQNFNPDSPQRIEQLLSDINQVDYIALSSARLSGNIPRVPAAWPVTSRYYATLADGELGFEKVAEFTSYPSIFGHELDDTGAEESYSVYDHPKVTIYKKTDAYSPERARQALHADAFVPGVQSLPGDEGQNALQFRPNVLATQQAGGTFSDIFHPGNVINRFPLFFWLLVMELAAFSLVPLAIVGFRGLPDRGFMLTKPLGILGLAYLTYAPASYGLFHFTRTEIAGMLALMVAFGLATAYIWRVEALAWIRERWRFVLFSEGVFLLSFLIVYWIRLQNPDLWHPFDGGEKPMDFAYLNGVIRTTDLTQGPIDPWNAGGYLNYYWFGQYIAATVTKLTGIVPEVAYNLIIPMFFALAASATFSIAYNLTESTRRLMRRRPGRLPISPSGPIIAGLLALFLVMFAGNLRAVGGLEDSLSTMSPWHSNIPFVGGVVSIIGGFKAMIFHDQFAGGGEASFHRLFSSNLAGRYDWWAPSRALTIIPTPQNGVTPITEFPFWTFLFADLHAHLMAIPFSMTAIGVTFGLVMNVTRLNPIGAAREHARSREISSWLMLVLLALVVGSLRWINSWDYPPFLLLGGAGLIIAERAKAGRFTPRVLAIGVLKAGVMAILSYALFANIAKNYNQAYGGFGQSDQTTDLSDYFSHFGVFLFLMTGFLLFALNRSITRSNSIRSLFFGSSHRKKPIDTLPVMLTLIFAAGFAIWLGTTQRWGVTILSVVGLVTLVLVAIREMRSPSPTAPIMLFVYAMLGLGLGLCGGVEVLTLDGDIGRMNTVFKFYLHVWMLWGVVSSFSLWYVFGVMQPQAAFLRRLGTLNATLVQVPRYAFAAVAVFLLALTLVYPYFGTRARLHSRFDPAQASSNDGLGFLDSSVPYNNKDDRSGTGGVHNLSYTRDGINWLRENVQGSPTTIEAIGPSYRSLGSRVAIYTGLPTVAGWGFHQSQQRAKFAAGVQQRQQDVNQFYATEDVQQARDTIRKYDVEWVIVGDEEKFNYPAAGMKKFETGLNGSLELMYENPGMQIWHVIPRDQLAAASAIAR